MQHSDLPQMDRIARRLAASHLANQPHGLVAPLGILLPEFREGYVVEIGEVEAEVRQRRLELFRIRRLSSSFRQNGEDISGYCFRSKDADPKIILDIIAELLERRHIGQCLGAYTAIA